MQGIVKVSSSQIGGPPRRLSKREKYLKKYKARDKLYSAERSVQKSGVQELLPRNDLPRKRPPHYISFTGPEAERAAEVYREKQKTALFQSDVTTFTNIVVGDPSAVMMQRSCRTPILPMSRASTASRPRQHQRCKTAQATIRRYDPTKSISWKYYGEVDQQMGCLTEHIRVRKSAPFYAKTLRFNSKTPNLYCPSPLTSTPRLI